MKRKVEHIDKRIWDATASDYVMVSLDVNEEWEVFKTRAGIVTTTRSLPFFFLKIAAVFMLGLFTVSAYFYLSQPEDKVYMAHQEVKEIQLSEGSKVYLNRSATLTVPRTFNKKNRTVKLQGDAYFEVNQAQHPFVVKSKHVQVEVLGTSFYIDENTDDLAAKVVVKSGIVRISQTQDVSNQLIVGKGEQASLVQQRLAKQASFDPNYLAWKTGHMIFDNSSLEEVLQTVSKVHGVGFTIDPQIDGHSLTVKFENQSLKEVLHIISLTLDLRFEKQGEEIVVLPS